MWPFICSARRAPFEQTLGTGFYMAQFPSLPLWTDSYLADTMHLDCMESGAYLHLLIAAWRSPDCMLPDDDKRLARFAKCSSRQWTKIKPAVMAFWTLSEHKWSQKRLLKERFYVTAKREQQSQAGKASALKRKETQSTDAESPLQRKANGRPAPIPIPIPIPPKKEIYKDSGEFENWYQCYPRKIGPDKARASYEKIIKSKKSNPEDLLEGLKRYCEDIKRNGTETKFIKHPATWLNQGCYNDDYSEIIHPQSDSKNKRVKGFAELAIETLAGDGSNGV